MKIIKLSRLRTGVYPLYYYHNGTIFLHAERLADLVSQQGFIKEINTDALALYFQFGYIPEPYSIYKNTFKLPAGHKLEYNPETNQLKIEKYWDIWQVYAQPKLELTEAEAIEQTEALMLQTYQESFASAPNPGVLLSGGYDSSSVAALLQAHSSEKIKTFSIGFHEPKFNEAHHAKRIAEHLGTQHYEHYCTQADALKLLPNLADILDEPMGDASIIPTTLVCQLAAKQVDSVLSADGPDELLGGYDKYFSLAKKKVLFGWLPKFAIQPTRAIMQSNFAAKLADSVGMYNPAKRLERFSYMLGAQEGELLKVNSSIFTPKELNQLLVQPPSDLPTNFDAPLGENIIENAMALDFTTSALDAVLAKVNRAATFAGIQNFEPVQNQALIEHFIRLPFNYKINQGNKKYLLKQIVHKYLPKELMDRPKMGFGVPLIDWFKDDLKDYLLDYLNEENLRKTGILNPEPVIKMRDNYLSGDSADITKLWYLLVFMLWWERWM